MFENLIAALKADKRKIVFTEGPDPRSGCTPEEGRPDGFHPGRQC